MVKLLLDAGADPTTETDDGRTIIHTDGSTDKELLPLLLGSGRVDVNELMTKERESPLFFGFRDTIRNQLLSFLNTT